jgi:hypothetical protein
MKKVISEYQHPDINRAAFWPADAEAVSGKDRLNPQTTEGIHRINVFLNHFFSKPTQNPHYEVAQLKARLNHLRLDFDFDNTKPLNPVENYKVSHGFVFGATPTTDLSKGFDSGSDMPTYNLEIRTVKTEDGFKMEGNFTHSENVSEAMMKRKKRIKTIREVFEKAKAKKLIDPTGTREKESTKKDFVKSIERKTR